MIVRARRLLVPIVAVAVAAALAVPAAASAADTTVTFNGLANNTKITDQYSAQGVIFGGASTFGFGDTGGGCYPGAPFANGSGEAELSRCGGTNEFPLYGSMGAFSSARGKVRVFTRANFDSAEGETFELRAYNFNRTLVGSQTAPVTAAGRTLEVTRGAQDIYYFMVLRNGISPSYHPRIDDLTFDNPPPPAQPEIGIGVDSVGHNGHLVQGSSLDIVVRVLRRNGSTGNVTLGVDDLPTGVEKTITPNPVGGSDFITRATIHLTAAPWVTEQDVTLRITAVPTPSAGSQSEATEVTVRVVPPFRLVNVNTTPLVTSCTPSALTVRLEVEPDFTEPIALRATSDGNVVQAVPPASYTEGTSPPLTSIPLKAGPTSGTTDTVRITASTAGGFSATIAPTVARSKGRVDSVVLENVGGLRATSVEAPRLNVQPTSLRIDGVGLCAGSTVFFGAGDSVGAPLQRVSADGTTGYTRVPFTATNGPVRVKSPEGEVSSSQSLNARTFRNTFGFSFGNFNSAGPAWEDIVALYGKDQTNIRVNPCKTVTFGFISCGVTSFVPRPDVLIYFAAIKDYGEVGNCYGLDLAAYRLWSGRRSLKDFSPAGAASPFGLDGAMGPAGPLRAYIRLMMLVQSSSEGVKLRKSGLNLDAGRLYQRIAGILAKGHPAMMSIRDADSGHAVVAYGLTPTPTGYDIEVYNPNDPYISSEDTSTSDHDAQLGRSRIHVPADGGQWSFDELGYKSGYDKISAYDLTDLPDRVSTPTGLDDYWVALSSTAHTALAPVEGATRLPAESGNGPGPVTDLIPRDRAIDAALTGSGGTVGLLGKDGAFQVDGTAKGLTLDKGGDVLGVKDAKDGLALTATSAQGGTARTATATFAGGGDDALGFASGSTLSVGAGAGGGTVKLTLGQTGGSGSASVTLSDLRLRGGETATVKPGSWTAAGSVAVTVKGKGGKSRKLTLRSRAAAAVAKVRSLKLKAKGATVSATARLSLPAGAPTTATLVWQARKGKAKSAARKGTVELTATQLADLAKGKAVSFATGLKKGRYTVKTALVLGSTAKGGVAPALATKTASVRVEVR